MRRYATPAAFRSAVEAKLRDRARRLSVPAYILRRQAALERLIVRLARVAPDRWAVKGGLALETRLGDRARVSLDLAPTTPFDDVLRSSNVGAAGDNWCTKYHSDLGRGIGDAAAAAGLAARRRLRRNPVGRLPLRLSLRLRSHQPGPAAFGPRPRGLRPDFDGPRPNGATRPVERAQCHGSGEGGSDPRVERPRPFAPRRHPPGSLPPSPWICPGSASTSHVAATPPTAAWTLTRVAAGADVDAFPTETSAQLPGQIRARTRLHSR